MLKHAFDPVAELAAVVVEERETIARLWGKRLASELHEMQSRRKDLREPLLRVVSELGRLLRDRGEDALRLWPEVVRMHGIRRYDLRYTPEDLGREMKTLHQVILRVYARHHGHLEPQVAELVAELMGEANAAVFSAYTRVLRTEEVRMRETATMESLLEHIEVGIVLAEEDGHISYVTPPVSRLIGLPGRVMVGAGGEALKALLTQLRARHLDGEPFRASELPFVQTLKGKKEVRGVVMAIDRHPDGREVILEMTALPVFEEGTRSLYGAVMTLADRTETTLRAREVAQAYHQLRRLQGRLLQRTRAQALGQLASGTAHALNNFLNVVRLRMTLLRKDPRAQHVDALERSMVGLGDLVSRLQNFAAPRPEEEAQEVRAWTVVQEGLEQARGELEHGEEPVTLEVRLEGNPRTRIDPVALRELTVNLALSARGRMPHGGTLAVEGRDDGEWLELVLRDTGNPIGEEELPYLFDPLKGDTSEPHLSLLLAVGRTQVQAAGGELWCECPPEGQGTLCHVRLPIAAVVHEPEAPPVPRLGPRAAEARRVLVVDDDAENARMMAEVLGEEGYDVYVAASAEEALRMWDTQPFDAALLDALMPDVSGWGIAREIRKRSPEAKLAVVTGADVRGQNRENLALVDAVFRKPIDVGTLDDFLAGEEEEGPVPPSVH